MRRLRRRPGYVPLGDITLLSSAPLSSEIGSSARPGSSDPDPSARDSRRRGDDDDTVDAESSIASSLESELAATIVALEQVTKERDAYLDDTRRVAAEFANFRARTTSVRSKSSSRRRASLAERLLPVLDACDGARSRTASEDVEPIYNMLISTLEKSGLSVLRPLGRTVRSPTATSRYSRRRRRGRTPCRRSTAHRLRVERPRPAAGTRQGAGLIARDMRRAPGR
jgi:hypothetical protein